jgi:addiction module HigA family antidote
MAKARRLPPVNPGEVLREDLRTPLGLSINGLARDLRVPVTRMSEIVNGRRRITADTALRLARYFHDTAVLDESAGGVRSRCGHASSHQPTEPLGG